MNAIIETLSKIKTYYYRLILPVILGLIFAASHPTSLSITNAYSMNISVVNIKNQKLIEIFTNVVKRYPTLADYHITLIQDKIKASTMQAQPVIGLSSLLTGIKSYEIKIAKYVRDSEKMKVDELDEEVLTGWFAHELGHVVDYEPYSNLEMIKFGIKYLISDAYKREVEHNADIIAINHGFKNEILASKRFILENELLDQSYKDKISKFYMSIEDVELCVPEKIPLKPITPAQLNANKIKE